MTEKDLKEYLETHGGEAEGILSYTSDYRPENKKQSPFPACAGMYVASVLTLILALIAYLIFT